MNSLKTVYIALGSNEGARFGFLQQAVEEIQKRTGDVRAVSRVYETPAMGFEGEAFLNACIAVESRFKPRKILKQLLEIESELGRKRKDSGAYQNRPIDLDIVLYEEEVITSKELTVPHPEMHRRNFVLAPLVDIASEVKHPLKNVKIKTLFETVDKKGLTITSEKLKLPQKFSFSGFNYIGVWAFRHCKLLF